jgi:hypothetical protein
MAARDAARSAATADTLAGWFAGQVPEDWFAEPPEVVADRDEVLVIGTLPEPKLDKGAGADAIEAARHSRIQRFREDTRDHRMRIATDFEARARRKVSWGVRCGDVRELFTVASVPVMTRLRLEDRVVLDTLVDASVARSRSEALAWCVRLVGKHQSDWIQQLRDALVAVEQVRSAGPQD